MPNMAMAENIICQMLATVWTDRTPVVWPNVVPTGPHPREGEDPWIALDIRHDGSEQTTMAEPGRRTFERSGSLTVRVFVPAGKRGLADCTELATVAANAYEGNTLGGVRFLRVGVKTVGRDGSWYQVNVTADFEFDEVK